MGNPARAVLNAASNARRMLEALRTIVDADGCNQIQAAIDSNVRGLFGLGESHFEFARSTQRTQWRQRISRFYYAAYNVRRAVMLNEHGHYSTDSSDHKTVDRLPDSLPNRERYMRQLLDLRNDRNLADYDHFAEEADLVASQTDTENMVDGFIQDTRAYLLSRGFTV